MKFKWQILFLLIPLLSRSQNNRIDSLTKLLPTLKDSSKINCLNKLSLEFYINALSETYYNVHTDTAIAFATKALIDALKINYKNGQAEALQNLGEIVRDRSDFPAAEQYFREAIPVFQYLNLPEKYNWTYLTLGWCLFKQSKYVEAKLFYERALSYFISVDNKERQSMLLRLISVTYSTRGYNEKAFENTLKAIKITYKISDARGVISSPENMGNLYKEAGETEMALSYFRLAAQNAKHNNPVRYNKLMGDICVMINQWDSAIFYYKKSHHFVTLQTTDSSIIKKDFSLKNLYIGEVYLKQHKYDLAIEQFKLPLLFFKKGNDKNLLVKILRALAKCYLIKQNFTTALFYTNSLIKIAQQTNSRPFIRDAYELYWKIYDDMGEIKSAYNYSLKYIAIKDSIMGDEYRRNIALSQMRMQDEQQKTTINLLQKDQQLIKEKLSIQQQKIKSESLLKNILFASIVIFILITTIILRLIILRRRNEKQRLEYELELQQLEAKKNTIEFQQQASELEMQALRAQMNPHFIFNCLSSINRFILINKTEDASDYLTKFSRLIRMALHNSEKQMITLESELEALRLYLDLERLRFKNAFNYQITFINTVDTNAVYIPPMMIQPFAENAIWHGLMHKKGVGCLDIQLYATDKKLICAIIDNGIGRNMSASFKSKSAEKNKSMGVELTAGRLALLNKTKNEAAVFEIEDLIDEKGLGCGTKVVLTMPYKDLTEVVD